jgi:hypothetical protein
MTTVYTITYNPKIRVSRTVSDPDKVTAFMERAGLLAYQFYVTEWLVPDGGEDNPGAWDINQQINGDEWLRDANPLTL